MFGQDVVDERLVADVPPLGLFLDLRQDLRINADGDQLAGVLAERGAPYAAHRPQLRIRQLRDVGEVDPTMFGDRPLSLCGSPASH